MKVKITLALLIAHISALVVYARNVDGNVFVDAGEEEDSANAPARRCPPWGKWQASKCLWPASQPFSSLPSSCISLPQKPTIPPLIKQFVKSKQLEIYSLVQNLFKLRGANSACGYCSRKIQCRQRQGGEWKRGSRFIQAKLVPEQCPGQQACVIKPVLGACPPPVPMPPRRRRHHRRSHHHHHHQHRRDVEEQEIFDQTPFLDVEGGPPSVDSEDEYGKKNATGQGPPIWHCARSADGSKCFCCCGWYLPNVSSGKCVKLSGPEAEQDEEDEQEQEEGGGEESFVDPSWTGMVDFGTEDPYDLEDGPLIRGEMVQRMAAAAGNTNNNFAVSSQAAADSAVPEQKQSMPEMNEF